MNTNSQRVYVVTNQGLYRSDDGGSNWRQMDSTDTRIRNGQGGYNCGVFVDPENPDIVYTFNTAAYKSTDGGTTFTGFKGAPGGDDPQTGWIDPTNGRRILLGYDQGAIVSLDGGATWSSWYNQSTEQVYHISADNSFPYWVYATQQDAGAVRTRARGDLGEITPLDWSPVNGWEWGTIVPDPLDPNTAYATGIALDRINLSTGQWISVGPDIDPSLHLRSSLSAPIVWAPWNHHELLAGYQLLMATTDGGAHWRRMSPDLTYPQGVRPPAETDTLPSTAPRPGAIETIAPSPISRGTIWVGTTNGLIKLTRDSGQTWNDVSIPGLPYPARAVIEKVEASPFDGTKAYAVVDLMAAGDYAPHIYRTRDSGKHWEPITTGLPIGQSSGSFARVVRADPKRPGLLFAGTESGMFISFNDGDDWQSLQLNLPTTPCRDIVFAGKRPDRGHLRAWDLGAGRLYRPAPVDERGGERACAPLHAPAGGSRPTQCQLQHAVPTRSAARPQSTRRRVHRLLARSQAHRRNHTRCLRFDRRTCATLVECAACSGERSRQATAPELLDREADNFDDGSRHEPHQLGPAV